MPRGLPINKSPEEKVFGIIGEIVSTDEGEVYTKETNDTRNIGWDQALAYLRSPTPTATPTVTPTSSRPFVVGQTNTPTPTPTSTTAAPRSAATACSAFPPGAPRKIRSR